MEVGLGPGDFVFDGDPATPRTEGTPMHHHPVFGPCLCPNGWMDKDATLYGSKPRPRPHCIRRGPSSARNGHSSPPSFRPVSFVATVAHLSYCRARLNFVDGYRVSHFQRPDDITCAIYHYHATALSDYLRFWRGILFSPPFVYLSVCCRIAQAVSGRNFVEFGKHVLRTREELIKFWQ